MGGWGKEGSGERSGAGGGKRDEDERQTLKSSHSPHVIDGHKNRLPFVLSKTDDVIVGLRSAARRGA